MKTIKSFLGNSVCLMMLIGNWAGVKMLDWLRWNPEEDKPHLILDGAVNMLDRAVAKFEE